MLKGLILCAGRSTRLYPITAALPKALIPVANVPILQTSVEKLLEQGITEIGIVIHPMQETFMREAAGEGEDWGVKLTYIYQHEPKGIADALRHAATYIGMEPFILLLGDNLFKESLTKLRLDVTANGNAASLLLAEVEKPQDFGIAKVKDGQIIEVVEKPSQPESNLAVLGAYAFTSPIFDAASAILPSARGEYEITDAIQHLINEKHRIACHITKLPNTDAGTIDRLLAANRLALEELPTQAQIHESAQLINSTITAPVSIAKGSIVTNSCIGPYVSISPGAVVENSSVQNSILLKGASVKGVANLKDVIIGNDSAILGM